MNRDADLAADCRRLERKLKQVTEERNSWKRWCEEAEAKLAALEPEPLEAPTVLAEGWAMPRHSYYMGYHMEEGEDTVWFDSQIRVYLDRAPKGSRPVTITAGGKHDA